MSEPRDTISFQIRFVTAIDVARVYRDSVYNDVPVVIIITGAPWLPEKLRQLTNQNPENLTVSDDSRRVINHCAELMQDFCFFFCANQTEAEKIETNLVNPLIESAPPELRSKVTVVIDIFEDKTPPAKS